MGDAECRGMEIICIVNCARRFRKRRLRELRIKEKREKRLLMKLTHSALVEIGYNWLMKRVKCTFAFKELKSFADEIPDVIGWVNGDSILVECKTSRADFKVDALKPFRQFGGIGNYRFYLAPAGVLDIEEVPEKWGFLEVGPGGSIIEQRVPVGNIWTDFPRFEADLISETIMLQSALRRINKKTDIQKYL